MCLEQLLAEYYMRICNYYYNIISSNLLLSLFQSLGNVRHFCDLMDCSPPGSSVNGILLQEYWSGLPFSFPGNFPNPGTEPRSLALAGRFFPTQPPGNQQQLKTCLIIRNTDSDNQVNNGNTDSIREGTFAGDQPRLIQGIRSGDGDGDLFNYLFIKDIKSNRIRIAQ